MSILESDDTLRRFIASFEAGTYPKADWTHRSHVIMAAWYWATDAAHAPERIKKQLLHYIHRQGIITTNESGYHETLTQFWIQVVGSAIQRAAGSPLQRVRSVAGEFGTQSKLHERYWRHDVVRDPVARREWLPPERPI